MDIGNASIVENQLTTFEKSELNDKRTSNRLSISLLDELGGGDERATGSEQIVDEQHTRLGLDGAHRELNRVGTVLFLIRLLQRRAGQLAGLAQRHEAHAERKCDNGAENEAACLEASDGVDSLSGKVSSEFVAHELECGVVAEQRCDVAKGDAFEFTCRNQ